jgi:hypothetical protein
MVKWKECQRQQLLSNFTHCIRIWLEELKIMKRTSGKMTGVPAKIKTEHLANINQKFYSLKQLDWWERSYDNQDVKVKVGK